MIQAADHRAFLSGLAFSKRRETPLTLNGFGLRRAKPNSILQARWLVCAWRQAPEDREEHHVST